MLLANKVQPESRLGRLRGRCVEHTSLRKAAMRCGVSIWETSDSPKSGTLFPSHKGTVAPVAKIIEEGVEPFGVVFSFQCVSARVSNE